MFVVSKSGLVVVAVAVLVKNVWLVTVGAVAVMAMEPFPPEAVSVPRLTVTV